MGFSLRGRGMKGHSSIDLLPESIQKQKKFRKLVIQLAALQAAIFLCIGAAAFGLRTLERRAWDESHGLALGIHALRHGPEVAAVAHAQELSLRMAAEDAFFRAHAPAPFDPAWVTAILETRGDNMTGLDYNGMDFLVTGVIGDIAGVEIHRQSILDTGLFAHVELGRIILQEYGAYFYELRVRVEGR